MGILTSVCLEHSMSVGKKGLRIIGVEVPKEVWGALRKEAGKTSKCSDYTPFKVSKPRKSTVSFVLEQFLEQYGGGVNGD